MKNRHSAWKTCKYTHKHALHAYQKPPNMLNIKNAKIMWKKNHKKACSSRLKKKR